MKAIIRTIDFRKKLLNKDPKIEEPKSEKSYLDESSTRTYFYCYLAGIMVNSITFIQKPKSSMDVSEGLEFMLVSLILSYAICVPVLLIEASIGQLTGLTSFQLFEFCPFFRGIGITCIMITIMKTVIRARDTAIWFFYFVSSLTLKTPGWNSCSNFYNSEMCATYSKIASEGRQIYILSSLEFYSYYISEIKRTKEQLTFNYKNTSFRLNITLITCICLVYGFALLCFVHKRMIRIVVIGVCLMLSCFCLLFLFMYSATIPGWGSGMTRFFNTSFSLTYSISKSGDLCYVVFYASGFMSADITTIASQNAFSFNFHRAVISVSIFTFTLNFLSTIIVFALIGDHFEIFDVFMNELKEYSTNEEYINFTLLIISFQTKYGRLWTIIFIVWNLTLHFNHLIISVEIIYINLSSILRLNAIKLSYFLKHLMICVSLLVMSLFLCHSWILYLQLTLFENIKTLFFPFILMLILFNLIFIYGIKQVRVDYNEMLRSSFSWFWFLGILVTSPIILCSVYYIDFKKIFRSPSAWDIVSYSAMVIFLFPIFFMAIRTIIDVCYTRSNDIEFIIRFCFLPPPYWGPRLKEYWLFSDFYANKLRQVSHTEQLIVPFENFQPKRPSTASSNKSSERSKTRTSRHSAQMIDSKYL